MTRAAAGAGPSPRSRRRARTDRTCRGTIRIDGSSTVQPLAEAGAELFQEEAPNVRITVGGAGTGDGFERFCRGETVISDASRAIEAEEIEACQAKSIAPGRGPGRHRRPVRGGQQGPGDPQRLHHHRPAQGAARPEVQGRPTTPSWASGFPDEKVSFFTPGTESGTYDYFTERCWRPTPSSARRTCRRRPTTTRSSPASRAPKGALGYVGFAFAEENKDKLKILAVDGGDGCVEAGARRRSRDGSYTPLSRPLFMYPSEKTAAQPEVKGFIDFILEQQPADHRGGRATCR